MFFLTFQWEWCTRVRATESQCCHVSVLAGCLRYIVHQKLPLFIILSIPHFWGFPIPSRPFVYGMWLCFTWADVWALPGQTDFLLSPPVSPLCLCSFLLHTPLLLCQGYFCSSCHPGAAPAVPQLNVCRDGRAQHFSSFLLPCTFHPVSVLSSTLLMNS